MDWPTFTVEMLKALAWLFVVLTALLLYRLEVRGLPPPTAGTSQTLAGS